MKSYNINAARRNSTSVLITLIDFQIKYEIYGTFYYQNSSNVRAITSPTTHRPFFTLLYFMTNNIFKTVLYVSLYTELSQN